MDLDRYGLDMTLSPPQSSDEESADDVMEAEERPVRPSELLEIAKWKRSLLDKKQDENLKRWMMQKMLIVVLDKHVEEAKKMRRERKRRSTGSSPSSSGSNSADESDEKIDVPEKMRKASGKTTVNK
ncbi:hypothetical protein GCK72_020364 [Caenorhabditis remanei]|uniref:Uncharacterized protein n=1 Tax=Caenorhabditis remanei TaxID=31234 RepID=A0A6A5GEZ4_CAERE|nr:hypothetical protein GCK72_020364 [Caenorhabditis remanei]KAF1753807.1 hypothetical protein GCK72_020364 [Caenorhabditis remanei]